MVTKLQETNNHLWGYLFRFDPLLLMARIIITFNMHFRDLCDFNIKQHQGNDQSQLFHVFYILKVQNIDPKILE